ncbi:MAG: TRAP transporter large permease subunit [Nitratireductor sp.]
MAENLFFVLLLLPAVLVALLSGMNAFLAIGGVPVIVAMIAWLSGSFDIALFNAIPARLTGIMENPVLIAVPLFILMGSVVDRSGLAQQMIGAMTNAAAGSGRRLSLSILALSGILAATTGVVGATIVMLTAIALPGMLAAGITKSRAAGLLCASGTLGQIIPPSILLVLLSDQISNSWLESQRANGQFAADPVTASDLFAAAFLPGLLLILLYGLWIAFSFPNGTKNAHDGPKPSADNDGRNLGGKFLEVLLPPILLVIGVLGSILAGIATPTEAASVGAAGAIVLAAVQGNQSLAPTLYQAGLDTIRLTGAIFAIIIAASVLSLVFRGLEGDLLVYALLADIPGGAGMALASLMLVVFILGFFMEFVEIIYIVIPVAAPALFAAGVDPVWFAVLVAMNLQTSFLTPPFGLALFYFRTAAAQVPTLEIWRGAAPYIILQIAGLGLVWAFPEIATWLPGLL